MTVVTTARLLLRPFQRTDLAAYTRLRAQPELLRFLPGGAAQAADAPAVAERIVTAFIEQWDSPGYGPWAVEETETGYLIGHLGLRFLPDLAETELLYMLDRSAWGRGLATEGALAACSFAFGTLGLDRLIAMAMPANVASIRVMQKAGLRPEAEIDWRGLRVLRYGLSRDEWTRRLPAQG